MSEPNVSLLLCLGLGGVSGEGALRFNIHIHTHTKYTLGNYSAIGIGRTPGVALLVVLLSRLFDGDGGGTRTRGNMCTAPTKPGTLLTSGVVCGLRV